MMMRIIFFLLVIISCAEADEEKKKIVDPFNFFCGSDDCYDILGLERNATIRDIKAAFRNRSKMYHPDKNKEDGAMEMFRAVTKAHEVLSDEKKKALFDYYLDHPREYYKVSGHYVMKDIPKSDVGIVVTAIIVLISFFMYSVQKGRYDRTINYLKNATMQNLGVKNGGSKETQELYRRAVERYEQKRELELSSKVFYPEFMSLFVLLNITFLF